MNIKVWYKLPSPPVEGSEEVLVPTQDMIVVRAYHDVNFRIEQGLLIIEKESYPQRMVAIYKDFERVEPVD